jgi:hypothetical protein
MKKPFILSVFFFMGILTLIAQTPKGFNYQAIIRNAQGEVIANQAVSMKISIIQGSISGTAVYAETFGVTTNAFGLVNLLISSGSAVSGSFETIDWSTANYFIKVELDATNSGTYSEMGTTQLLSVPYANYAFSGNPGESAYETWLKMGNTGSEEVFMDSLQGPQGETGVPGESSYETWLGLGNTGTEEVFMDSLTGPMGEPGLSAYEVWLSLGNTGTEQDFINSLTGPSGTTSWTDTETAVTTSKNVGIGTSNPVSLLEVVAPANKKSTAPLFEVKNSSGKTVFAIYENDVKIFLDKDSIGAFSVNSRDANDLVEELITVNPTQTTIYVDSAIPAKAARGGFAVSGRTSNKADAVDMLSITNGLTEIFVDEATTKGARGGFAVSGRTSNKGAYDIMSINTDSTRFYIDANPVKSTRGGFAVSGRTSNKGAGDDILMVTPNLTEVFVDEALAKSTRGGFAVSGRTSNKAGGTFDIMHVQPQSTDIFIKSDPTSKSFPDGFTISGYNQEYQPTELFMVSELGTIVNTTMAVAPKVVTYDPTGVGQTSAYGGGSVTDHNNTAIVAIGILYSISGDLTIDTDFSNASFAGIITTDPAYWADFQNLTMYYLQAGVTYQVRAFATNSEGLTGYGPIKTFTTLPPYKYTFDIKDDVGAPIPNATITVKNYGGYSITNPAGNYVFMLGADSYDYSVVTPGYYDYNNYTTVSMDNDTLYVNIGATSPPKVTFIVKDEVGNPITNEYIDLTDGGQPTSAFTDGNGEGIAYLNPGKWYYTINSFGYKQKQDSLMVTADLVQTHNVTLTFAPTYTVTFTVTRGDGITLADSTSVNLYVYGGEKGSSKGGFNQTVMTNASGVAVFTNVPEGNYDCDIYRSISAEYYYQSIFIDLNNVDIPVTLGYAKK